MRFKDVIIGADDFDFQDQALIAQAISEHIIELGLATTETLTGFTWRIDVRMRTDNAS